MLCWLSHLHPVHLDIPGDDERVGRRKHLFDVPRHHPRNHVRNRSVELPVQVLRWKMVRYDKYHIIQGEIPTPANDITEQGTGGW